MYSSIRSVHREINKLLSEGDTFVGSLENGYYESFIENGYKLTKLNTFKVEDMYGEYYINVNLHLSKTKTDTVNVSANINFKDVSMDKQALYIQYIDLGYITLPKDPAKRLYVPYSKLFGSEIISSPDAYAACIYRSVMAELYGSYDPDCWIVINSKELRESWISDSTVKLWEWRRS